MRLEDKVLPDDLLAAQRLMIAKENYRELGHWNWFGHVKESWTSLKLINVRTIS